MISSYIDLPLIRPLLGGPLFLMADPNVKGVFVNIFGGIVR
ncbi:MAG: hypothetical protein HW373_808, partial [Deltaproteobacteria bacterium]|nr:hypothetical protein [Deltaproteobacteria bacterium]